MADSTTPAPIAPIGAVASKVVTHVTNPTLGTIEHTISSVHVNGWLLLAVGVALNLVGVIFHF